MKKLNSAQSRCGSSLTFITYNQQRQCTNFTQILRAGKKKKKDNAERKWAYKLMKIKWIEIWKRDEEKEDDLLTEWLPIFLSISREVRNSVLDKRSGHYHSVAVVDSLKFWHFSELVPKLLLITERPLNRCKNNNTANVFKNRTGYHSIGSVGWNGNDIRYWYN